jgi:hypothetical protein
MIIYGHYLLLKSAPMITVFAEMSNTTGRHFEGWGTENWARLLYTFSLYFHYFHCIYAAEFERIHLATRFSISAET